MGERGRCATVSRFPYARTRRVRRYGWGDKPDNFPRGPLEPCLHPHRYAGSGWADADGLPTVLYLAGMRLTKSLTAFLSAAALSAAVAGCASVSGDEEVIGSDTVSTDESSPAEGDTAEEAPSDDVQDFEVESGFSSGTDSIGTKYNSAGALLTNPNPDLAAYGAQVLFNLVGPGGDVLDTTTETVSYIGPGETVPVGPLQIGFDLKEKPTKLEVQVVGDFTDDEGPKDAFGDEMSVLTVKKIEITQSDYGRELSGQVTNETDEIVTDANWDCVYMSGEKIVGGASSSILDPIPPGSTVQFSDSISVDDMPAKNATCRVISSY